jgi:hypothetical protein
MLMLTCWIHDEFGDKDLLDWREKVIRELKSAGDDILKLRSFMPEMRSINAEIDRLTIERRNRTATT